MSSSAGCSLREDGTVSSETKGNPPLSVLTSSSDLKEEDH